MLSEQSETYRNVRDFFANKTEEYLRTGIARFTPAWQVGATYYERCAAHRKQISVCGTSYARAYLRQVAKELGRPFVVAVRMHWEETDYTTLTVPKRKSLEVLASALLLGAAGGGSVVGSRRAARMEAPLVRVEGKSNWKFVFNREEGAQMFEQFVQNWQQSPEVRAALKLQ